MTKDKLDFSRRWRLAFETLVPPAAPDGLKTESEEFDETQVFWGKVWDELSFNDFDQNRYCLGFFPGTSFAYFFGALIHCMLKENSFQNGAFEMMLTFWLDASNTGVGKEEAAQDKNLHEVKASYSTKIASSIGEPRLPLLTELVGIIEQSGSAELASAMSALISDLRLLRRADL